MNKDNINKVKIIIKYFDDINFTKYINKVFDYYMEHHPVLKFCIDDYEDRGVFYGYDDNYDLGLNFYIDYYEFRYDPTITRHFINKDIFYAECYKTAIDVYINKLLEEQKIIDAERVAYYMNKKFDNNIKEKELYLKLKSKYE